MRQVHRPIGLIVTYVLFALVLTGCLQTVGASLPATPAGGVVDPNAAFAQQTFVAETANAMFLQATQTAGALAFVPTQPPFPSVTPAIYIPPTETAFPTFSPFSATMSGNNVAPNGVITGFAATNTPVVVAAQQTAIPFMTATPFIITATPVPTLAATQTPFIITATPDPALALAPTSTLFVPTLESGVLVAQAATPITDPTQAAIFTQAAQILATVTQQAAINQTATAQALGTFTVPGNSLFATPVPGIIGTPVPGTIIITVTPQGTPGAAGSGAAGVVTAEGLYIVEKGDRLIRIAMRFNTTVRELARINGIVNTSMITPGQVLRIPGFGATPTPIVVTTTPSGPLPPNVITLQPGATLDPNATIIVITATPDSAYRGQVYVVQEGDTLYSVASRFRVSVTALAQYNGITNYNLIYIGQELVIP